MIEKLAEQMEFKVVPIDPDHPESGNKIVGHVVLGAEKELEGTTGGLEEEFIKSWLTTCIHNFLYAELKTDLNELRRAMRDIKAWRPDDKIGICEKIKAADEIVLGLLNKIRGI